MDVERAAGNRTMFSIGATIDENAAGKRRYACKWIDNNGVGELLLTRNKDADI